MEDIKESDASPTRRSGSFTSPVAQYRTGGVTPDFGSPKELELSNSLSNLKWGFRRREEKLLEQLAIHKEALHSLYETHVKLKAHLNETGAAVVNNLEAMEDYNERQDEQAEAYRTQEKAYNLILQKLELLETEKAELEMSKADLQGRLDAVLTAQSNLVVHSQDSSTISNRSQVEHTANVSGSATPRSLVAEAVYAAYRAAQDSVPPQLLLSSPTLESPKSVSSSPRRRPSMDEASPLKDRRKSTGSTKEPSKKGSKDPHATERSSRKPAVPKQEEIRKSLRKLSSPTRRLSSTPNSPHPSSHVEHTAAQPFTPKGPRASSASADNDNDGARSTEKSKSAPGSARVSLRKRIEDHHAQQQALLRDPDNNPWRVAYSTSTRASQGGCQFFVDLVPGQEDAHPHTAYSPRNGSRSVFGTEEGALAASRSADEADHHAGATDSVELLRMESVDLQDLRNVSLSHHTNEHSLMVIDTAEDVLDTDSLDGDRAHIADTRISSSPSRALQREPVNALQGGAASTPGSPAARGNKQMMLDVIRYKRQISELQSQLAELQRQSPATTAEFVAAAVVDTSRVNPAEVQDAPCLPPISSIQQEWSMLEVAPSLQIAATDNLGPSCDVEFDNIFVELVDAAVQCDDWTLAAAEQAASTSVTSVSTNTDAVAQSTCGTSTSTLQDSRQLPLSIGSPGSPHHHRQRLDQHAQQQGHPMYAEAVPEVRLSPEDALLMKNIENSKFQLGKKLFEMRFGAQQKANDAGSKGTASGGGDGRAVPIKISVPSTTKPVASSAELAAQRAILSETLQLNSTLISRLKHHQTVSGRSQRKVTLLEEKLCRLIMFIKASAKAGTGFAGLRDEPAAPEQQSAQPEEKVSELERLARMESTSPLQPTRQQTRFADSNIIAEGPDTPLHAPHRGARLNTTLQDQQEQLRVGNMSFGAGLEELLCFSEGDASDEESAVKSLFSPAKDFQGRRYDELEESKLSVTSNPLRTAQKNRAGEQSVLEQSRMEISFNNDSTFFDMPRMESLGDRHAEMAMFSPIPLRNSTAFEPRNKFSSVVAGGSKSRSVGANSPVSALSRPKLSTIRGASSAVNVNGRSVAEVQQEELLRAQRTAEKLEQQLEHLTLRNKNLAREKELLLAKLKHHLDGDSASFGLKVYTSDAEIALDNPTKTLSLVMGFIANNNALLDEISALKGALDDKSRQLDAQSRATSELRAELNSVQRQNYHMTAELEDANKIMGVSQYERESLQGQVSQLTSNVIHLAQENKLLKEKMRLYQY